MWWFIGVSTVGMLVMLFLLGKRNERAVRRDWELLLTPRGEKVYRNLERRVQTERELATLPYDEAIIVHELGSVDEAIRLLDAGYRAIEHFAPNMLRLLGAMATYSRMVAAMAPAPPLNPRRFRLAQIVSLTALGRLLHEFLVSTGERFRLRVYILAQSFSVALRFLVRSRGKIADRDPEAEREWQQIKAIRHDIEALTDESLESLRVLLTSLAAEQKDSLLDELPRR
jgi:hypothetical protein